MRFAILLFSLLMFAPAFAAEQASESDAQKAARYTAALEKAPFASDAKEMRRWVLVWLTDTKDYRVLVCVDVLGPLLKKKPEEIPFGPELMVQQMFGNVAYQINNPGKHDEATLQVAGMESLLKVYAQVVARNDKARLPYFDNLLAEQKKGALKQYLAPVAQKCGKKT